MADPVHDLPPMSALLSTSVESSSDGTASTSSWACDDAEALDMLMGRCEHLSARFAAYSGEPIARPRGAATSADPGDSVASSVTHEDFPSPAPLEPLKKKRRRQRKGGRKPAADAAGFEGRSP